MSNFAPDHAVVPCSPLPSAVCEGEGSGVRPPFARITNHESRITNHHAFTLIELLVVIAIIAILSAVLMPALSSATDRSRVTECRAHLAQVGMALQMYATDWGGHPAALDRVLAAGYVTNDEWLRCTKTGAFYYYLPPAVRSGPDAILAACVAPATPVGQRPHGFRRTLISLTRGGKLAEK